jgi:hypothetical protein
MSGYEDTYHQKVLCHQGKDDGKQTLDVIQGNYCGARQQRKRNQDRDR